MLIFLVGFMGSGKTTIGKLLGEALQLDFFDLDDLIEKEAGSTISEIFKAEGQEYFRSLENAQLKHLGTDLNAAVIATGGGTPCYFDNMEQLNKKGTTIYLELSAEKLFDRLKDEADFRPLLVGKNTGEMKETISDLLDYRKKFYKEAIYTVDADRSQSEILDNILYLINE